MNRSLTSREPIAPVSSPSRESFFADLPERTDMGVDYRFEDRKRQLRFMVRFAATCAGVLIGLAVCAMRVHR